jgi:hypothetical protein
LKPAVLENPLATLRLIRVPSYWMPKMPMVAVPEISV